MDPVWNLDGGAAVSRTLAIPLVARARARDLFPELKFEDREAERLVEQVRFSGFQELLEDRKSVWGSIVRSQVFDDVTSAFLENHSGATVLNLGAGLCTRRSRLDRGTGRWIEADFSDVIDAKRELCGDAALSDLVAIDLEDTAAVATLVREAVADAPGRPVLVIAEGVLMFLEHAAHRRLLEVLARELPTGSQIVFDYLHPVIKRISRIHPSLKVTGAAYQSGLEPARDLLAFPRLKPLELRLFSKRCGVGLRLASRVLDAIFARGSRLYDVALLEVQKRGVDGPKESRNHYAVVANTLLGFVATIALAVWLDHPIAFAAVALPIALLLLRAFCLQHELSHGILLGSRGANDVAGFVTSLINCTPYFPWKRVHIDHHKWAGHVAKDPTESDLEFDDLKPIEQLLGSLAWRTWFPLLTASFSLRTFWNLPRLFRLYRQRRDRWLFVLSVVGIPLAHGLALFAFGAAYALAFFPGFVLFLALLDPLAISQHVGIPVPPPDALDPAVPIATQNQERLARTLIFPRWFARHVLLGFNYHSLHHARPRLPGHVLDSVHFEPSHAENWWVWLKRAKAEPLSRLLARGHAS